MLIQHPVVEMHGAHASRRIIVHCVSTHLHHELVQSEAQLAIAIQEGCLCDCSLADRFQQVDEEEHDLRHCKQGDGNGTQG